MDQSNRFRLIWMIIIQVTLQFTWCHCEQCEWELFVIDIRNLSNILPFNNDGVQQAKLTKELYFVQEDTDLYSNQVVFHSYPFNLLLTVNCNKHRKIPATSPKVLMCNNPTRVWTQGKVCKMYYGASVDLSGSSCQRGICTPGWIVPIQFEDESNGVLIDIQDDINGVQPLRAFIIRPGYLGITHEAVDQILLENVTRLQTFQSFSLTSPCFVIGPIGNGEGLYLTCDEFNSLRQIKEDFLQTFNGNAVCNCTGASSKNIIQAAILVDRLVLLTKSGLFEVVEKSVFESDFSDQLTTRRIFDKCGRKLVVSNQLTMALSSILVIGGCDIEEDVYEADIRTMMTSEPLQFRKLVDVNGGPCGTVSNCAVITCAHSALNQGTVFCLLKITHEEGYIYQLVKYKEASGWELISTIPGSIMISPNMEYILKLNNSLTSPQTLTSDLQLSSIILTFPLSKHIYITGNVILHSPDGGYQFYILPRTSDQPVELTTLSSNGNVIFCSKDEIWFSVVGQHSIQKIFPSTAWDVIHEMNNIYLDQDMTLLSAFFDKSNRLQLIMALNGSSFKHAVPLNDILQYQFESQQSRYDGCRFSKILLQLPSEIKYSRTQTYSFTPPLFNDDKFTHDVDSLLLYHATVQDLDEYNKHENSIFGTYGDEYRSDVESWRDKVNKTQPYNNLLFYNNMISSGVHIDLDFYKKVFHLRPEMVKGIPDVIYLGYNQQYSFSMYIVSEDQDNSPRDKTMDHIGISVESSNPDIISLITQRHVFMLNNTIKYKITIKDRMEVQQQNSPGLNLYPTSVVINVLTPQLACFKRENDESQMKGKYVINVQVGCAPSQHIVFDWMSSWNRLRDSELMEKPFNCLVTDERLPCYYFSNTFYPYFNMHDDATGEIKRFTGNYTLKIVAGRALNSETLNYYSTEDVSAYNNQLPNATVMNALIWAPTNESIDLTDGWPIFNHKQNALSWFCQPNSPCANVMPHFPQTPEYYFLFEFSNVLDNENSYCDFTETFLVHIHGLPISSDSMSVVLVCISILFVIFHVIIYFVLHRNKSQLYKRIKNALTFSSCPAIIKKIKVDPVIKGTTSDLSSTLTELDSVSKISSSQSSSVKLPTAEDDVVIHNTAAQIISSVMWNASQEFEAISKNDDKESDGLSGEKRSDQTINQDKSMRRPQHSGQGKPSKLVMANQTKNTKSLQERSQNENNNSIIGKSPRFEPFQQIHLPNMMSQNIMFENAVQYENGMLSKPTGYVTGSSPAVTDTSGSTKILKHHQVQ